MAKLNGAERIRLVALAFKGTPKGQLAMYFGLNKGQVDAILQKVAEQGLFTCCKRWYEADAASSGPKKIRKGVPKVSLGSLPQFKIAAVDAVERLHYAPYIVAKVLDLKYDVVYGWLRSAHSYNESWLDDFEVDDITWALGPEARPLLFRRRPLDFVDD